MDRRERKERKGKGRGGLKGGTEFAPPRAEVLDAPL